MHARAEQGADVRDALVILLALAAGAVDAISFFGLGGAFAANMTGNVVLLGAAAGGFTHALLRCGAALVGYLVGAYAAARWVRNGADGLWPAWMTRGLLVVALAECCVLGGWLGSGGRPGWRARWRCWRYSRWRWGRRERWRTGSVSAASPPPT